MGFYLLGAAPKLWDSQPASHVPANALAQLAVHSQQPSETPAPPDVSPSASLSAVQLSSPKSVRIHSSHSSHSSPQKNRNDTAYMSYIGTSFCIQTWKGSKPVYLCGSRPPRPWDPKGSGRSSCAARMRALRLSTSERSFLGSSGSMTKVEMLGTS